MMTLQILSYNNYYNRLVKQELLLEDYQPYLVYELTNSNFNPNDNIDTEHIIGNGDYDGRGDYLLVVNEFGDIVSRWFIIEAVRTRAGQWKLSLHRDVIIDYYDIIVKSPVFIEKGYLPVTDNGIFNSEDMSFDQILKSQNTLKDRTECPWIVGYLTRDLDDTEFVPIEEEIVGTSYASSTSYPYYQYATTIDPNTNKPRKCFFCVSNTDNISIVYKGKDSNGNALSIGVTSDGYNFNRDNSLSYDANTTWLQSSTAAQYIQNAANEESIFNLIYNTIASNPQSYINSNVEAGSLSLREQLQNQDGNIIIIEGDGAYRVVFREDTSLYSANNIVLTAGNVFNSSTYVLETAREMYNTDVYGDSDVDLPTTSNRGWLKEIMTVANQSSNITNTFNRVSRRVEFLLPRYCWLELQKISTSEITTSTGVKILNTGTRPQLIDAPWDMFCIPYSDQLVVKQGVTTIIENTSKDWALRAAFAIANKYSGGGYLYDLQLLPYCPIRDVIVDNQYNTIDITNFAKSWIGKVGQHETVIRDNTEYTEKYNIVLYPTKSNGTFNIPYQIKMSNNSVDVKVQNQCDMWRLCSPNYSSAFEFNVARNNGIDYMNVDYTYRPYNPYIHINPNFKRLYGYDANDVRGLICTGSFALPTTSDSWKTYELNNKTYETSFKRSIESQELQNKYQKQSDIVSAATGALSGAASGGLVGSMLGGGLVGGIIGGVTSAAAGAQDVYIKEKLRTEALQLQKDQFGYQLENIQALPNTISNAGTFTYNTKYFPFIEYYSCGDEQKQALKDKIKYNGMTIMRIGHIEDYINSLDEFTYVKGKLIRLEGIEEDFHIINVIADELYKGVYIK